MAYHLFANRSCSSCKGAHNLAVRSPAYAQFTYEFKCPTTGDKVLVTHLPRIPAPNSEDRIPSNFIEAVERPDL